MDDADAPSATGYLMMSVARISQQAASQKLLILIVSQGVLRT
jgi:hypothetical protein